MTRKPTSFCPYLSTNKSRHEQEWLDEFRCNWHWTDTWAFIIKPCKYSSCKYCNACRWGLKPASEDEGHQHAGSDSQVRVKICVWRRRTPACREWLACNTVIMETPFVLSLPPRQANKLHTCIYCCNHYMYRFIMLLSWLLHVPRPYTTALDIISLACSTKWNNTILVLQTTYYSSEHVNTE